MSEKVVRTYHNVSNRAKARDPAEHKVVFKSALDSPFQIAWPKVSLDIQNAFLARVISLLSGVSEFHRTRRSEHRKMKRQAHPSLSTAKLLSHSIPADTSMEIQQMPTDTSQLTTTDQDETSSSPPSIYQYLTIGINAVTRKLESLSTHRRTTLIGGDPNQSESSVASSLLVLVCHADVDPPVLLSHLPSLVAACNSARPNFLSSSSSQTPISWLVPLPRGAETALTKAIGLKRVSVLAFDTSMPTFSDLTALLDSVPVLTASWLAPVPSSMSKSLVQTHIKQIRTSAPLNMKAAKEKRSQSIKAAKERRRARKPHTSDQKRTVAAPLYDSRLAIGFDIVTLMGLQMQPGGG